MKNLTNNLKKEMKQLDAAQPCQDTDGIRGNMSERSWKSMSTKTIHVLASLKRFLIKHIVQV